MDPFVMALDAQFGAPGSMAAVLERVGFTPLPVRTIRSQPDQRAAFGDGSEVISATNVFLLRQSEPVGDGTREAVDPAQGDMLVIEAGTFVLTSDIVLDAEGMQWTCGAEPYRL